MSRIQPANLADTPDAADHAKRIQERMGFVPNAFMIMARVPRLMNAFAQFSMEVNNPKGALPKELRVLAAYASSYASGCRYCQAHTATTAGTMGISEEKIASIWKYETDDIFDDCERAVLRFSQVASQVPNMVEDSDFEELQKYLSEEQIIELMAVIAFYGFLNRWNDSLATTLEAEPLEFAENVLADSGWTAGKHSKESK